VSETVLVRDTRNTDGFADLSKALRELDPRKQVNAIRNALRASLKETKKTAERLAPVGERSHKTYKGRLVAPGFAKRNININTRVSRDKYRINATIGTKNEAFYIRQWLEKGNPGRGIVAQPWLRPAYEIHRTQMTNEFKIQLREKIIAQAKKVRKPRVRR
jgi:hypothetical protein